MAWSFLQGQPDNGEDAPRFDLRADGAPDELLRPIMAGAYVRGLSDVLGMLGLPALFLDRSGRILASNGLAAKGFGSALRIESDHIVATTSADNAALSRVLAEAVNAAGGARSSAALQGAGVSVHAITPPVSGLSFHPLAAILVFAPIGDPTAALMIDRLEAAAESALPLHGKV